MGPFGVLFLIGRILFATLFLLNGLNHLMQLAGMAQYAGSKGVPAPKAMVAATGVMILLGGLSILFWWWVPIGAWLLVVFLLVAAFMMHNFWAIEDPMESQNQMAHFMKNLALAGAAICFYALHMAPDLLL